LSSALTLPAARRPNVSVGTDILVAVGIRPFREQFGFLRL
jgi:hypothetical protein